MIFQHQNNSSFQKFLSCVFILSVFINSFTFTEPACNNCIKEVDLFEVYNYCHSEIWLNTNHYHHQYSVFFV